MHFQTSTQRVWSGHQKPSEHNVKCLFTQSSGNEKMAQESCLHEDYVEQWQLVVPGLQPPAAQPVLPMAIF